MFSEIGNTEGGGGLCDLYFHIIGQFQGGMSFRDLYFHDMERFLIVGQVFSNYETYYKNTSKKNRGESVEPHNPPPFDTTLILRFITVIAFSGSILLKIF